MRNRIKELRELRGWSQDDLAEKVGTTNQQIGRLENGERKLSLDWMERLAKPLRVAIPELIDISGQMKIIRLIGNVQAGIFQMPLEEQPYDGEWISIPLDDGIMKCRPYALKVMGPSMNRVYAEGTVLVCCHLEDLQEEPISGKRYIIEDQNEFGQVEVTVKEFVIDENGRPWAWPRSSDPAWQEPVALDVGKRGHTIRVRARVVYSMRQE